jgi:hypothetical protein
MDALYFLSSFYDCAILDDVFGVAIIRDAMRQWRPQPFAPFRNKQARLITAHLPAQRNG